MQHSDREKFMFSAAKSLQMLEQRVGGEQIAIRERGNTQLGHGNNKIYPTFLFN
jgi:hypothetical protein